MKRNPVLIVLLTAAVLGAIFFGVLFLGYSLTGGKAAPALPGVRQDRVALVKIEGVLLLSDEVVEELRNYTEDSSIKAIVIRIDSPGGGVVPSQEMYNAVKNARKEGKKVVVSMGSIAASGGYYIAVAADRIIANPGTLTGSIGVKMEFANIEQLLEKIGVEGVVVKSGKYKDIGSPFHEMTPQEKKLLQNVLDDVHSQFIKAVVEGRNLPEADVRAVADGRIFTGRQALKLKLVDEIGDLAESIRTAGRLAGIKGEPVVVEKKKKISLFEFLREESAAWIGEAVNKGIAERGKLQYLY